MLRCIQLAKNGLGTTYPNPLVGSVIVHNDQIIGEGWHLESGQPHAEVNAVKSVKDRTLLSKATIYVSLEPCSHFGKTPPCSDLIIESGIRKVVVGSLDPNPKVSGRGIERLKDAGCEVAINVLKKECDDLNKRFFTFHTKHRPYIILKWAQTKDCFIAPIKKEEKKPVWITHEYSKQVAHRMRAQEQAILVGTNTVIDDNPSLTTRNWKGSSPMRVVLDRTLRIDKNSAIYDESAPTIIINQEIQKKKNKTTYEVIDFSGKIAKQICDVLYRYHIQSLVVEGGSKTLQTFIDANMWDEAFVFTGNKLFNEGINAPQLTGVLISEEKLKDNTLTLYKNQTT